MFLRVASILAAAQLVITVANEIPRFNIDATCRADAAASASIALSQTVAACKQDEQNARDQLVKQWAQFRPSDRATCASLASEADADSYVELLTCLEMARETRE
jgi:hypothetical protein